jgi:hypothetical protein
VQILFLSLGAYDPRGNSFAASVQLVAARRLTQNGGPLLLEGSFEEELVEPDPLRLPTTTLTTHGTQNEPQQQLQEQQQQQQPLDLSSLPLPGDTARVYEGVCKQVRSGLVPALRTLKVFRSGKHRPPTAVTVVTQLSIDRLAALELQCSVWGSSIAAAVHVPLLEGLVSSSLEEIDGQGAAAPLGLLQAFHDRMESEGSCTLDMVYVTEEVPSADFVGLYPVNALRNRALQLALTDVVLLLDADFIPNRQLSEDLTEEEMYKTLVRVTSVQQAIILPAFEVLLEGEEGKNAALRAAESKDNIRRMIGNHRIQGFHIDGFVNGHRATDFERWQTASVAYRVEYEEVRIRCCISSLCRTIGQFLESCESVFFFSVSLDYAYSFYCHYMLVLLAHYFWFGKITGRLFFHTTWR